MSREKKERSLAKAKRRRMVRALRGERQSSKTAVKLLARELRSLPAGWFKPALVLAVLCFAAPAFAATTPRAASVGVNVNSATLDQLSYLPGVGPAIAQRIVDARSGNRHFGSVADLCGRVKGLSGARCRDLAPYALFGREPTTAIAKLDKPVTVEAGGKVWYVCPLGDRDADVSHQLVGRLPCPAGH